MDLGVPSVIMQRIVNGAGKYARIVHLPMQGGPS